MATNSQGNDATTRDKVLEEAASLFDGLSYGIYKHPSAAIRALKNAPSVPCVVAPGPRSTYTPFTIEEINLIRGVLDDGTYTKQERNDIGKLCDMAVNCLLYAQEIHRLREAPPSPLAATDESKIAALLVDLEFLRCNSDHAKFAPWKEQHDRIRAFLVSLAPGAIEPNYERAERGHSKTG